MMARRSSTSAGCQRPAEGVVEALGLVGRRAVEGEGDQHRALALDQVVAGGLAGDARGRRRRRAGRRAAGRPRPGAARSATGRPAGRGRRRRARRRSAAAARWSTSRTCSAAPSSPRRRRRWRGPAPRRRGTGRRSPPSGTRANSSWAGATRSGGSPHRPSSSSAQPSSRSPSRIAPGGAVLLRVAAPAVLAVLGLHRPVGGGVAAPGVGGVHVVVVDQRTGVQQLQGRAGADERGRVGGRRIDRVVAPPAERRPEAFAAGDGLSGGSHQAGRVVAQGGQSPGLFVEEIVDRHLELCAERCVVPTGFPRHADETNEWTSATRTQRLT